MKSLYYSIKNFFVNLFYKSRPIDVPIETPVENPQFPITPEQPVTPPTENIWQVWTRQAMSVSGAFEGKGEDWGNPVGNFDDAGLTCGLLGFTWKWNNQPPMVKTFIARHGRELVFKLMPKTGHEYIQAVNEGESRGFSTVASWSSGSRVHEPYKTELHNLWNSEEMRQIQIEKAWDMMGAWAKKKCIETQMYFKLPEPKFAHFTYWFDQAVLNGQGKTVALETASQDELDEIIRWCSYVGGHNTSSIRACGVIWKQQLKRATEDQKALFVMAWRRSLLSRSVFGATTMTRRGSLALGVGVVNESRREYDWKA